MEEAIFGILGVLVGSFIPWIKEERRESTQKAERAQFLAVRVICLLDEYASKCVDVVCDDGTVMGQASARGEDGMEYYRPVEPLPKAPSFPDDLDWKSIDGELMYRILTLPNSAKETDNYIQFISDEIATMPDYPELFEARWQGYATLGLEAMNITDQLRGMFGLPHKEHNKWNKDWDPRKFLEDKLSELKQANEKALAAAPPPPVQTAEKMGDKQ